TTSSVKPHSAYEPGFELSRPMKVLPLLRSDAVVLVCRIADVCKPALQRFLRRSEERRVGLETEAFAVKHACCDVAALSVSGDVGDDELRVPGEDDLVGQAPLGVRARLRTLETHEGPPSPPERRRRTRLQNCRRLQTRLATIFA